MAVHADRHAHDGRWARHAESDLLKIPQLYLAGGEWAGRRVVLEAWVKASLEPRALVRPGVEYGYLWWLPTFEGRRAFMMTGSGGQKVIAFPELGAAMVITTTDYGQSDAHGRTDRLLTEYVLPALAAGGGGGSLNGPP